MPLIELRGITRWYRNGRVVINALSDIDLAVGKGEFVTIMGPSGSGKSTLLNIIGCLDRPSGGEYILDGMRVERLSDDKLSEIRNRYIGFVFQSFHLLPGLDAMGNAELPLIYRGVGAAERRRRVRQALEAVGLSDRIHHKPSELSGGEQQRVAIARALAQEPLLILADEPTGALDSKTGRTIMELFRKLNAERGITIIMVTHDRDMARYGHRIVKLLDGRIKEEELVG
ncbi:ABC transporter ATP-binding protein [Thermosediminibacter litoriperuensis]|uniref:Putative ABC transport system ATP-binding protein n=1 Tax=Thermosediminibacter litoriperuensis TaxID=291989 RepID=A0A5S5ANT1_9FIRM|nr:ABC transporter ATP-binding protein [Thermosediminibacter litoriperuensis]TYP52505.1 putative ABC transport system ATP-binding protein [Thermosediminibacter litoriperuensis]